MALFKVSKVESIGDNRKDLERQGYSILDGIPVEFEPRFRMDMTAALMNIAGVSVSYVTRFLSYTAIENCYSPSHNLFKQNVLEIGLKDRSSIRDYLDESAIDYDLISRPLFIHIDTSLTGDRTGLGCGAVMGYNYENRYSIEQGIMTSTKELVFKEIFNVAIQCPTNDEISFQKTRDFIFYLKNSLGFNIRGVSMDGFQCLPADTLIKTCNGDKRIVDLDPYIDKVYAYDAKHVRRVFTEFTAPRQTGLVDELCKITTIDGREILCTANHPILTGTGYLRADVLSTHDRILEINDIHVDLIPISNVEIIKYDTKIPVYDIEVPRYNNFVLSNDLVVHNSFDTRQQLELMGFDSKIVSLDKTENGYMVFKSAISEKRISLLNIPERETELVNLEQNNMTGKIDHPLNYQNGDIGRKDMSDATAGWVYNAFTNIDKLNLYQTELLDVALEISDEFDTEVSRDSSALLSSISNNIMTADDVINSIEEDENIFLTDDYKPTPLFANSNSFASNPNNFIHPTVPDMTPMDNQNNTQSMNMNSPNNASVIKNQLGNVPLKTDEQLARERFLAAKRLQQRSHDSGGYDNNQRSIEDEYNYYESDDGILF